MYDHAFGGVGPAPTARSSEKSIRSSSAGVRGLGVAPVHLSRIPTQRGSPESVCLRHPRRRPRPARGTAGCRCRSPDATGSPPRTAVGLLDGLEDAVSASAPERSPGGRHGLVVMARHAPSARAGRRSGCPARFPPRPDRRRRVPGMLGGPPYRGRAAAVHPRRATPSPACHGTRRAWATRGPPRRRARRTRKRPDRPATPSCGCPALAVPGRVDVGATGDDQPIQPPDQPAYRHPDRRAAAAPACRRRR